MPLTGIVISYCRWCVYSPGHTLLSLPENHSRVAEYQKRRDRSRISGIFCNPGCILSALVAADVASLSLAAFVSLVFALVSLVCSFLAISCRCLQNQLRHSRFGLLHPDCFFAAVSLALAFVSLWVFAAVWHCGLCVSFARLRCFLAVSRSSC